MSDTAKPEAPATGGPPAASGESLGAETFRDALHALMDVYVEDRQLNPMEAARIFVAEATVALESFEWVVGSLGNAIAVLKQVQLSIGEPKSPPAANATESKWTADCRPSDCPSALLAEGGLFCIAPLKWGRDYRDDCGETWTAEVPMGSYTIGRRREHSGLPWAPWKLGWCFDEYYDESEIEVGSFRAGTLDAQTLWHARLAPALIPQNMHFMAEKGGGR